MLTLSEWREIVNMRKCGSLILTVVFIASCLFVAWGQKPAFSKDELQVIDDKDKTVYSMSSDDDAYNQEQERDKERAWQMLQNQNVWIDGRGKRPNPGAAK
jgi:hypothetical protein